MSSRANTSPRGVPFVGFAAYSGTGKTTLLKALIADFAKAGVRVALIKHAHHDFDTDVPGKDSYELRKAGARHMIVSSSRRRVEITELDDASSRNEPEAEATLDELLALPDPVRTDIIFVEGFKRAKLEKIELYRPSLGHPLLAEDDAQIIAVASDTTLALPRGLPNLNLNHPPEISAFIRARFLRPGPG